MLQSFLAIVLIITAIFLILLILIQRGRGGGLAGAFGGMGGQSAFGTKAGDLFTRITIGVAAFWIVLCVISVKAMGNKDSEFNDPALGSQKDPTPILGAPAEPGTKGQQPTDTTGDAKSGAAAPSTSGGGAAPAAATGGTTPAPSGSASPAESPTSGDGK